MLLSPAGSNASLPKNSSLWGRFTGGKKKGGEPWEQPAPPQPPPMALTRTRFLTLVHEEMETVRKLPDSFVEAEACARDWVRPPPGASFHLRVPVEYASFSAARYVQGPYLWVSSEDTWQLVTQGVQGLRLEIVSDAPPPEADPPEPPPPPPPPVLEMPATFNLELSAGQTVALDTLVSSDDLDMSKTEDGTTVDGSFWGKLEIVHQGDKHTMEFTGTRIKDESVAQEFIFDQRALTKLQVAAASKPTMAKCNLSVLAPTQQYCDITISLSAMWRLGVTWPPAEPIGDSKVKFFLRVHPGGALEHFDSSAVVTSLYYEALPDTSTVDPVSYIAPYNGFAMSSLDFIPHLSKVLEDLGLSLQARTLFISNAISSFSLHKYIAYRFMSPSRLSAAIDLAVTTEPCVWTRIFLMWRGVSEEEMPSWAASSEKEAMDYDWKAVVGWSEASRDQKNFRVLETSIMECA